MTDHPRSRGVYLDKHASSPAAWGSSPLARGLHAAPTPNRNDGGIIPARAGFTAPAIIPENMSGDHPRSRGVYRGDPIEESAERGSSPLARGLLWTGIQAVWNGRIIPARAGFTHGRIPHGGFQGDHPRSRGVYAGDVILLPVCVGSSPLARGLQVPGIVGVPVHGIIPARAGFTETPARCYRAA